MIPTRFQALLVTVAVVLLGVSLVCGAPSCSILHRQAGAPVDLAALADDIDLARQTVLALAPKATPATQEKLRKLSDQTLEVEAALLAAAAGGPIADVKSAAVAALDLADKVLADLAASGKDTGDLGFWVGIARVGVLALSQGDTGGAAQAIAEAKASAPPSDGAEDGPR